MTDATHAFDDVYMITITKNGVPIVSETCHFVMVGMSRNTEDDAQIEHAVTVEGEASCFEASYLASQIAAKAIAPFDTLEQQAR